MMEKVIFSSITNIDTHGGGSYVWGTLNPLKRFLSKLGLKSCMHNYMSYTVPISGHYQVSFGTCLMINRCNSMVASPAVYLLKAGDTLESEYLTLFRI